MWLEPVQMTNSLSEICGGLIWIDKKDISSVTYNYSLLINQQPFGPIIPVPWFRQSCFGGRGSLVFSGCPLGTLIKLWRDEREDRIADLSTPKERERSKKKQASIKID